ncbi:MAG: hypothetical protein ACP5JH_11695 [Bacteroidota bacterium]
MAAPVVLSCIRRHFVSLVLFLGILVTTYMNINLQERLRRVEKPGSRFVFRRIDSLEGLRISCVDFHGNREEKSKDGVFVFFEPPEMCCSCLQMALDHWIQVLQSDTGLRRIETVVCMEVEDPALIGFLEYRASTSIVRAEVDPGFVRSVAQNKKSGVCMFVKNAHKILYAEELSLGNLDRINVLLEKVRKYADGTTLPCQ